MGQFRVTAPDGRSLTLTADNEAAALDGAKSWAAANPPAAPKGGKRTDADVRSAPGYQAARKSAVEGNQARTAGRFKVPLVQGALDLLGGYDPETGLSASEMALPLPIGDEIAGAAGVVRESIGNLGRMATGRPTKNLREVYLADKDVEEERRDAYRKKKPIVSGVMETLSGIGGASKGFQAINAARTGAPSIMRPVLPGAPAVRPSMAPAARALRAGKTVATGAAVGGAMGAAYGAADADGGLEGRARGAMGAAGPGAALGGVFGLAAPTLINLGGRAIGAGGRAVRDLGRHMMTEPLAPGEVALPSASHTEAAEEILSRMAADEGLFTPEAVMARHSERYASDPAATGAEVLGRRGIDTTTALTRRPGQSGQIFEDINLARREETPGLILDSARDDLRVDPLVAREGVEKFVEGRQKEAGPLYREAFGEPRPIASPTLDRLQSRPSMQRAQREAVEVAREADRDPRALGLRDMDATPDGLTAGPGDAPIVKPPGLDPTSLQALAAIRAGVAGRLRQGPSLATWLRSRGGVSDAGGDLRAMGMGERGRADVRRAGGLNPEDDGPLAAFEAGYFDKLPTPDEFREALVGAPRYARRADPAQADLVARIEDVEQRAASAGIDLRTASNDEIAAAFARQDEYEASLGGLDEVANREPLSPEELYGPGRSTSDAWEPTPEPVRRVEGAPGPDVQPTPSEEMTLESWDLMKRGLDRVVEAETDSITGKLSPKGRAANETRKELLKELDTLTGGEEGAYSRARGVSGDGLSVAAAFRDWKGKLTRGSVGDFARGWKKAKPGEREAIRATIANDLLELAEAGQLRAGKVSIPRVRQKLELAFGREEAAAFLRKAEARAKLNASGSRMDPRSSSVTGVVEEYNRAGDLSEGLKVLAPAAAKLKDGNWTGALGTLTMNTIYKAFSVAKTSGMPVQVRDELGRMLSLSAEDLAEIIAIRAAAGRMAPRAPMSALPGGMAGGVLGGSFSQ